LPEAAALAPLIPGTEPEARSRGTPRRSSVEPLTAELRRLHLTVSRRFLQKLEAVRTARSHASAGATVEALLEEALDLLLEREVKRRTAATERPLAVPRPAAEGAITAEVRREVWARDGGRCQWPLEAGGVCGSTWQVEIDHVRPKGRGGPPTAANLRLLCRAHNAESARRAYGADFVARARRRAGTDRSQQDRSQQDHGPPSPPACPGSEEATGPPLA
jgi:5-methylcytosine-specific restriction endonuclease McrA